MQTWDAFDFFTVSLTVENLSEDFGVSKTDITWGITLVLMFRSVGSILFGIAADRYGRKWPFIVNNLLFIALELVSVLHFSFGMPTLHSQALPSFAGCSGAFLFFYKIVGLSIESQAHHCEPFPQAVQLGDALATLATNDLAKPPVLGNTPLPNKHNVAFGTFNYVEKGSTNSQNRELVSAKLTNNSSPVELCLVLPWVVYMATPPPLLLRIYPQ